MKRSMKKLCAIFMAMMMLVLTCTAVLAGTVRVDLNVDQETAGSLMTSFGIPEEQIAMFDPIFALVNALGVDVVLVNDGGEARLDLNGKEALTVSFVSDEQGYTVASSLFPNYAVTIKNETIAQMMQQYGASIPGMGGDEAGFGMRDMAAVSDQFADYLTRIMEASQKAAAIGEPETGAFEFDGVKFDTRVPITIDVQALGGEVMDIVEEMLNNESIMGMIQGYAQSTGGDFDYEAFKAGILQMDQYFPENASAEFYTNSDGSESFYMTGQAAKEGQDEFSNEYTMLFVDQTHMNVQYWDHENNINAGFSITGSEIRCEFSMEGMYMAFDLTIQEGEPAVYMADIYFMNSETPILSATVSVSQSGERTLQGTVDGALPTVAFEELMSGQGEASQGLMTDLMTNGLGALMTALNEEVPGFSELMSMFTGAASGSGTMQGTLPAQAQEGKQVIQLGSSRYTIEIDESFVQGELTQKDIDDDMVAYYRSDNSLLDFDIYQFSKEGYPENLADFVNQEAAEYDAFAIQTDGDIWGIPFGSYNAKETYEGVEYETETYVFEDDGQYIEITFWLDGIEARQEASSIIFSLSAN